MDSNSDPSVVQYRLRYPGSSLTVEGNNQQNKMKQIWNPRNYLSVLRACGSIPGRGKKFLSSPQRPDWLWDQHGLLCNGYRGALSPGVNRPGREADHSPPSNGGQEWWKYTSIPPYVSTASWLALGPTQPALWLLYVILWIHIRHSINYSRICWTDDGPVKTETYCSHWYCWESLWLV
jgi:hypothetical protein